MKGLGFASVISVLLFCLLAGPPIGAQVPQYPPPPITVTPTGFTLTAAPTGGSGTYTYNWTQVYGPAPAMMASTNQAMTSFGLSTPGTYLFRVVVTDTADSTINGTGDYILNFWAPYRPPTPDSHGISMTFTQVPAPASAYSAPVLPLVPTMDQVPPVIKTITRLVGSSYIDATTGSGSLIAGLNNVTIRVNATDNVSVWSAVLLADGFTVGTLSGSGDPLPATFDIAWRDSAIKPGAHAMTLRVFDSAGNMAEQKFTLTK